MNLHRPALPPGSLIYVGDQMKHTIHLHGTFYNSHCCRNVDVRHASELPPRSSDEFLWLNVNGVHRVDTIREVGEVFGIPALTLEDIVNTEQRPKLDELDDSLFIVVKMLYLRGEDVAYEHLAMILNRHSVLTFHEQPGEVFEPVRRRLELADSRIRHLGPDYLAYALLDAVVDHYLLVLDHIEGEIEELEQTILNGGGDDAVRTLHDMQQELIFLAKNFRGGREVLSRIQRRDLELIGPRTRIFLGDVDDHMLQAMETVTVHREVLNGLDNLHFSLVNQKTNEIIKVLTLFASLFMPLTFVAGIYGMNFENMPELTLPGGYPAVLILMLSIAGGLLFYFRKRGWL